MRIIAGTGASTGNNPFLLSEEEKKEVARKQVDLQGDLTVPRRPPWTRKTTRLELEKQERDSFLDWRRELAQLAEASNLLLTPFERNVQLWRQLWRVVERSHLIVQIVDARNPLGFRCIDLERYVREVGDDEDVDEEEVTVPGKGKRRSLLLINKADLLTYDQRLAWADWFEKHGVVYAFFSAVNAAAELEQEERQRQAEADEDYDEEDTQEDEDEESEDNGEEVSGDEVESDEDEDLSRRLNDAALDDDEEEGWSTEDEAKDSDGVSQVEDRLANGERVALKEAAQEVDQNHGKEEVEDIRTRVLSVAELEELFERAAPDLQGTFFKVRAAVPDDSDFATPRQPHPNKLVVGLVGYPNVGKSSTINALLGAKKVSVSSTPGKTKHFQTLVLSDHVTLCDCPGLVFPQFANTQADMVVDGVLPIDQMREYSAPVDLLCQRIPQEILEGTYGIAIDVKDVEDGGTGQLTWEEFLSTYAIARGMTRASFGMPDTSRAARYVLKDYVNAKLIYAHPPPGVDANEFMATSRAETLAKLEAAFNNGKKRAPVTHVSKNADTFVQPASSTASDAPAPPSRQRQLTTQSVRASAASAPMRGGKAKSAALDEVYFTEAGPAPRPVVMGRNQQQHEAQDGGLGFARPMLYPHQRILGPDGRPLAGKDMARGLKTTGTKRHFKGKEGKKRSGRGYD
ncbi:hypothetical protein BCR39DRAFT_325055 [Naematelia encephala]|uniref:G domain-containing protein n=1 Tax=Naematelia encephala TaxID=71784 RepID=A0A1Y2APC9_9TREE|nr:hypothetical protein BCR39DRAFT_325055 [Naematelia encephala]